MVSPTGQAVRVDDAKGPLRLTLELNKKLADYLVVKKAPQKYWVDWFVDYVLDMLWEELNP